MAMNGGPVMAEDNIINRRGGESLYQICVNLKRRLVEVPGFEQHFAEMEEDEKATDQDPVAAMWLFLQRGIPLMTLYNASQPDVYLTLDQATIRSGKVGKKATFKFLQACMADMHFPATECFLIVDLYNENTTGFVKVAKMVNKVLDMLELQGRLQRIDMSVNPNMGVLPGGKMTQRQHILKELLDTERDYVHHLQNLLALKKELEETGALSGDSIHQIFLNLNNLLDFAQRFLIKVESHNALPEAQQNWGLVFTSFQEAFRQYEPFIANQMRCDAVCQKEWDKIQAAPRSSDLQQMVAVQSTLNGFFMKPFQRLTKYPLILQSLAKVQEDPDLKTDLLSAKQVIQDVLDQANISVNHENLVTAKADLQVRVDDWKALKMDKFGDMLRYGTFTVLKGDGGKDTEREVGILFDDFHPKTRMAIRRAVESRNSITSAVGLTGQDHPLSASYISSATVPDLSAIHKSDSGLPNQDRPALSALESPCASPGPLTCDPKLSLCISPYGLNTPVTPLVSQVSCTSSPQEQSPCSVSMESPSLHRPKTRGAEALLSHHQQDVGRFRRARSRRTYPSKRGHRHFFEFNGCFSQNNTLLNSERCSNPDIIPTHRPRESWKTMNDFERAYANELALRCPSAEQYHIYLFERILLCCKDINPNKQKSKLIGGKEKLPLGAKGKPRLQLKGRIFMANVTDIIFLQKPGSYTIQIFWKGDPGVENFVIKYQSEEIMRQWYKDIDEQRAIRTAEQQRTSRNTGTSDMEFTSLMGSNLTNPYAQNEDPEEFDVGRENGGQSEFQMSRNASSTSLRSRSATGGSGGSMSQQMNGRPPPRFPMDSAPLTVHTQFSQMPVSPGDRGGNSYFSPSVDSPVSTRSSSQSTFGRHIPGGWTEDTSRHTAPAMSRPAARESNSTNPYMGSAAPSRAQRPSLPAIAGPHAQPVPINQSRLRSASSPDIHNHLMHNSRRYQQSADNVPVPPIPAHMQNMRAPLNRSQSNSPTNGMPMRASTQSPGMSGHLPRHPAQHIYDHQHQQQPYAPRSDPRAQGPPALTPSASSSQLSGMSDSTLSPTMSDGDNMIPSQLKAKVNFDDNYVTLVIASNIHFRSLIDRVDAKLSRFTSRSIGGKTVRLRYKDEDGDFITIDSDEAVQLAFLEWRDQHQNMLAAGQVGEIQLYCQSVD